MSFEIVSGDFREVGCDALLWFTSVGSEHYQPPFMEKKGSLQSAPFCIISSIPEQLDYELELELLRQSYRAAFQMIAQNAFKTIVIPLSIYGRGSVHPALENRIIANEIEEFLKKFDAHFTLVVDDEAELPVMPLLQQDLQDFIQHITYLEEQQRQKEMLDMVSTGAFPAITDEAIEAYKRKENKTSQPTLAPGSNASQTDVRPAGNSLWYDNEQNDTFEKSDETKGEKEGIVLPFSAYLSDQGKVLDESFSQMVLRKIIEKGYKKDSDCYAKANIDRRLFSRIRCDENYHPKKTTALALSIALELSLNETKELLQKAGYSLSHSILSDIIIEYCIINKLYNIYDINELLFHYNQPLLGG